LAGRHHGDLVARLEDGVGGRAPALSG
jgi:hypothetical protein